MSRPACKNCWDPVDRDNEELCDWCQMTPEQRNARMRRDLLLVVLMITVTLAAVYYSLEA